MSLQASISNDSWDFEALTDQSRPSFHPAHAFNLLFTSSPKKAKRSKSSLSSVTAPCAGETDDEDDDDASSRRRGPEPISILVGYAFGPKKMSTMSIIMAEASEMMENADCFNCDCNTMGDQKRSAVKGHCSGLLENEYSLAQFESRFSKSSPETRVRDEPTIVSCGSSIIAILKEKQLKTAEIHPTDPSLNRAEEPNDFAAASANTMTPKAMHRPFRVSFVPLDLNFPLEEQHGGNFDAILHKLTEDILLSTSGDSQITLGDSVEDGQAGEGQSSTMNPRDKAMERLNRLVKYKEDHPWCCLVDPPDKIQKVLSRADIANALSTCLLGVKTKSGVPVFTPRFYVCTQEEKSLASRLDELSFRFPLISKPLAAAGTSDSHKMIVFLNSTGLSKVPAPCLLQEYANHDGVLYKVYVLGDEVYVFQRPSLPNLPVGKLYGEEFTYVEFDSQKPYPKLSDFGVLDQESIACSDDSPKRSDRKRRKVAFPVELSVDGSQFVTAEEMKPVARAIQQSFCLELFGFDILVTRERGRMEMMVVDVNYFPSFKEVVNFPTLLTQYLARHAIASRLQSWGSR